jgi:lipopolysaccharide/colanic/teichoic acid biosynthesis glycosyltransferase
VAFVPRLFERMSQRLTIDYVGGVPLVMARRPNPKGLRFRIKYAADRLLAAGLLVLASPVMLGAALAVWLSLGRPLFFKQRRVGRDGREFDMLKFRTMRAPEGTRARVPRRTRPRGVRRRPPYAGNGLPAAIVDRRAPQLVNVLVGHMSIVGPRPERPLRPASRRASTDTATATGSSRGSRAGRK